MIGGESQEKGAVLVGGLDRRRGAGEAGPGGVWRRIGSHRGKCMIWRCRLESAGDGRALLESVALAAAERPRGKIVPLC